MGMQQFSAKSAKDTKLLLLQKNLIFSITLTISLKHIVHEHTYPPMPIV